MLWHEPVLLKESIKFLITNKNGTYCDATVGHGGHSLEILKTISNNGFLLGVDQDQKSIEIAFSRLEPIFKNFLLQKDNFFNLNEGLKLLKINYFDGIIFDLGYSKSQITNASRGFSYRLNGELDMRMDQTQKLNAYFILNHYSAIELNLIFLNYGEIKDSRMLTNTIIKSRLEKKIKTTFDLIKIIKKSMPKWFFKKKHPGRKIFQALRIAVNNELEILKLSLNKTINLLKPGARLVVISYHSLEDRIVKNFIKTNNQMKTITKKPIIPTFEEIEKNYSAKSAKMRVFERTYESK